MMSYGPGSIVRITLHDFMTFKYISVEFGPKLNVIVGSNGSGKSSLACAIVLGLAGKVKNLERAGSLNEFIRRGCKEGKIEIELFLPDGNITVQRQIFNDKSTWFLNGASTTLKLVEAKMKELSIQVDNLCQFLPQDKVHDFAKMSKQELLVNTQNSVGSPFLAETFQQLIDIKKTENTSEAQIKDLENRLIALNEKHVRLAKAWERVKDKQKMSDEVNALKKKLAWVKYECKKKELAEEERQKKEKEKELLQIKLSVKPFLDEINELKKTLKKADDAVARYKIKENENHGAFKNLIYSAKQWHRKIQVYKEEYEDLIVEKSKKDEELQELENKIAELEDRLNQDRDQELVYRINEVTKEIEHVTIELNKLAEIEYRCEQVVRADEVEVRQIERKVNEVNNVLAQKLQLLKDTYPDVYTVREYVQKNENMFAGKIYGPIFLELIVEDNVCAKYVEEVIPLRDMIAFVCEEAEDVTKLAKLSSSKKLLVNVFEAPANEGPVKMVYKPRISLNVLKSFGFLYYIANIINGPEPVLRYLCDMYRLHEIPVGVSKIENCLDSIPQEIRRFFSETQQFTVSISRYSRERSTRCSQIRNRVRLLKYSAAKPDEELQKHLEQKSKALHVSRQHYDLSKHQRLDKDKKKNELFDRKKTLLEKAQQVKFLKVRRENYKKELLVLQSRDIDLKVEEQKKNLKIKEALLKSSDEIKKSISCLKKFQEAIEKRSICSLDLDLINKTLVKKEGNFNDTKKKINVAEVAFNVCQRACLQLKEDVRQLKNLASKLTDNLSDTDPIFSKKYGRLFSRLPNDIEGIENRISEVKALADCLMGTDENVEEEYKAVVHDLENLKDVISSKKSDRDKTSSKIKLLKDKWLPEINRLVERINKKFSLFFQQMNCVGEVSLSHADENDFSSYGLSIRVKFRDSDSLQELDRYSQSGGERSVTIAVYMLSLQELTRVPFRCVDEINQGMDETNEKRIYHLLMETIGDSNLSQYFLITPKLLKGIEFSEHVTVHTVMCGEQCTQNDQSVVIANFLKRLGDKNQSVSKRKRTIAYSDSSDSE